jgi:hypothetical protein
MARSKKKSPGFRVKSLLVCDDIREEKSGKEIIIGVYTGAIIFAQLPAKLNKIVFRIDVQFLKRGAKQVAFQIRDEKKELKFELIGSLPEDTTTDSGVFIFELAAIDVQTQSWMNVWMRLDDDPWEKVGGIELRGPTNEQERSLIAATRVRAKAS